MKSVIKFENDLSGAKDIEILRCVTRMSLKLRNSSGKKEKLYIYIFPIIIL